MGTSRPVRLTQQQKRALVEVIEVWGSREPGGLTDGLPDGIVALGTPSTPTCTIQGPTGSAAVASRPGG